MNDRPSHDPANSGWWQKVKALLPGKPQDRHQLIEQLRDAEQRDLLDADALSMMEGVVHVSEMQVRDVMVPRSHMVVVEQTAGLEDIMPVVVESAHSRFPVIGDNRDEVVGTILAKSLLYYFIGDRSGEFNIRDIMLPPVFIPESKRLNVLLHEFRTGRNHMAIVVDEYGGVAGLVTIEDVLEQIVGEIEGERGAGEDTYVMQFNRNEYTVKALTPIDDFNEVFGTDISDEEYDTIGGFIIQQLGHLPKRGEVMVVENLRFRVLRADNRRVHLLHVSRLPEAEALAASPQG